MGAPLFGVWGSYIPLHIPRFPRLLAGIHKQKERSPDSPGCCFCRSSQALLRRALVVLRRLVPRLGKTAFRDKLQVTLRSDLVAEVLPIFDRGIFFRYQLNESLLEFRGVLDGFPDDEKTKLDCSFFHRIRGVRFSRQRNGSGGAVPRLIRRWQRRPGRDLPGRRWLVRRRSAES